MSASIYEQDFTAMVNSQQWLKHMYVHDSLEGQDTQSLIQFHGQLDPTDISNVLSSAGLSYNILYIYNY